MDINDINEINTTGFSGTDPEVEKSIREVRRGGEA